MELEDGQNPPAQEQGPKDQGSLRHQLVTFTEIGKALTSSLDMKEVLGIVMEKIRLLLRPDNWSLLLLDKETQELKFEIAVGKGADKLKGLRLKLGEGVAGWVAKEKTPLLVPDVTKDPRFSEKADRLANFKTQSIICVPLVTRGKCLGAIELINKVEEGGFSEEDLMLLTALADFTAIAIENAISLNRVHELTITDDLTRLYNSRFLHSRLEYEMERAKRFRLNLSMIFLDLDYFKNVNDQHGHLMGSKLLREIAALILGLIRNVDMACRYGGDEFIILMPETSKKNTVLAAHKLRDALNAAVFLKEEGINLRITGSFGVASYPVDAQDKDGLIQMADKAMYKVKNNTRDAVAEA